MTKKILLVDDNERIRGGIKEYLEALGYSITTATDGEDDRRMLFDESLNPDYVLTDTLMPRINGLKLLQLIHNNGLTSRIKTTLMSQSNRIDDIDLTTYAEDRNATFLNKDDIDFYKRVIEYFPNN